MKLQVIKIPIKKNLTSLCLFVLKAIYLNIRRDYTLPRHRQEFVTVPKKMKLNRNKQFMIHNIGSK